MLVLHSILMKIFIMQDCMHTTVAAVFTIKPQGTIWQIARYIAVILSVQFHDSWFIKIISLFCQTYTIKKPCCTIMLENFRRLFITLTWQALNCIGLLSYLIVWVQIDMQGRNQGGPYHLQSKCCFRYFRLNFSWNLSKMHCFSNKFSFWIFQNALFS